MDISWRQTIDATVKISKGMETPFLEPTTNVEREIKRLIDEFNAAQAMEFEKKLFKKCKRLADAKRVLEKTTVAPMVVRQMVARK